MKLKTIHKIIIDLFMTIALLLLMSFELIGSVLHEWIGIGMFIMFILHHALNWKWSRSLLKGKYTAYRILQTILAACVLAAMLGLMVSSVILSRSVFAFLSIESGLSSARTIHMLSAYWGFVFMSLHLGLHWGTIIGMIRSIVKKQSQIRTVLLRSAAILIAGYGVSAFISQNIGSYMFLVSTFVFFDFEVPLILFFIDYVAIMGLFVFIGYYVSILTKKGAKVFLQV